MNFIEIEGTIINLDRVTFIAPGGGSVFYIGFGEYKPTGEIFDGREFEDCLCFHKKWLEDVKHDISELQEQRVLKLML